MKRRSLTADPPRAELEPSLGRALAVLDDPTEVSAFLGDLCTPAELEALCDRWRVVPWLLRGVPYREIHEHTAVSVTTIGRVARALAQGAGGYRLAAHRLAIDHQVGSPLPTPAPAQRPRRAPRTGRIR
ncbi:MAG: YerC/YecD family TrpR-related protein [Lysobacterales bacterium]